MATLLDLKFYAVQNSEGNYFHRKGYSGYGNTWTSNPAAARIYTKIGQARSIVTFFANHYKDYPAPHLVEIIPGNINFLDETARVAKAVENKNKKIAKRALRQKEYRLNLAKKDLLKAQEEIAKFS